MQARVYDRIYWRAQAQNRILRGLTALESGRISFGDWERLHLSAAIDQFRNGHFESSAQYAQRIMSPKASRQPFAGRFTQDRSLASFRAEYEKLAVLVNRQEPTPSARSRRGKPRPKSAT
jgi:hypothetical protein